MSLVREGRKRVCVGFGLVAAGGSDGAGKRWRLEETALLLYIHNIWKVILAHQATAYSTQHPSSYAI